ncbi:MAG: Zn-dependent oxidoreductase [Hyphomicrobiales bacterium]|nr:MAG: Zn-dependent oxidoreductase [Hyphomicrobiales bacterium]
MKAYAYHHGHELDAFAIEALEVLMPEIGEFDVLVKLKAIGLNPVDYKIRQTRSAEDNVPVILGWDASGRIEKIGNQVKDFKIGDEVFYAGDITRAGSYAEYQAIDSRIIALKPKHISHVEAAALPLTSLTAWEGILDHNINYTADTRVLIIGGAGGVGSMAIQLIKATTDATIITTASRADTIEWCQNLGVDYVINHHQDLAAQLKDIGIDAVDVVFCTTNSERHIDNLAEIIRPFGHVTFIQDNGSLDIASFKFKSITTHWEFMFSKSMFGHDLQSQGDILAKVAQLIDGGKIKSTLNNDLGQISCDSIKQGHSLLESGKSIGKIVLEF